MTYVVSEKCLSSMDRSCLAVCPVDCIYETSKMLVINPAECIDCGACEPECPVEAIFNEEDLPVDSQHFRKINALIDSGVHAVDQAVETYLQSTRSEA